MPRSWAQIAGGDEDHHPEEATKWSAVAAESEEVEEPAASAVGPTAAELGDLRLGLAKVWALGGKLRAGVEYELDLQGYATRRVGDHARRPLFKFVSEEALSRPTFAAFVKLLDNYEREVGKKERVTSAEKAEESAFLDAVLETEVMRYCHAYLCAKRAAPSSRERFKALLGSLWFQLYVTTKGGPPDSSGFEHVFVGEERTDEIVGMHNWIQLYVEERKGYLDYYGYVARDKRRPPEEQPALSLQFAWTDAADGSVDAKSETTSLLGTSPELELALFTLAALAGGKHNPATRLEHGKEITQFTIEFGDDAALELDINCVKWSVRGHPTIRTCFPSIRY
mmetsp:Transcript_7254/g.22122  ORF Transcript_7254/g.22122 Transcript_7254/m.22122 type:complete len:339 (+) Transcript_7254:13-1029(+)